MKIPETKYSAGDILNASSSLAIISCNLSGTVTSFNRGAEALIGVSAREVVGRMKMHELMYSDESRAEAFRQGIYPNEAQDIFLRRVAETGCEVVVRSFVRADGTRVSVSNNFSCIRQGGAIVGFLIIANDITLQLEREAAERDRRRMLESIEETIPDIIYIINHEDNSLKYFNRQLSEQLGYSDEELKGLGSGMLAFIVHPDDLEKVRENFKQTVSLREGETIDNEFRLRAKNGEFIWLRSRKGAFRRNMEGKIIESISVAHNITREEIARKELSWTNTKLEAFSDSNQGGIFDWDLETNKVDISPRWRKLFRYEHFDLNLITLKEMIHPDDMERYSASVNAFISGTEDVQTLEYRLRNGLGNFRWVSRAARLIRNEAGKPVRMLGTTSDITDRKETELIIENQSHILETLLSVMDAILTRIDPHGVVIEHRGKGLERLNLQQGAFVGRNIFEGEWVSAPYFEEAIIHGHSECYLEGKSNGVVWYSKCYFFKEAGGNITGFFVDLTKSRDYERELLAARIAADEANNAKSTFLANMSHEIRTPMNGIMGYTELLAESTLNTEQQEYVDIIAGSSQNLLGIINDILDFSKIEAGKLDLSPLPFNFEQSVGETVKIVSLKARQKGLELICDIATDVPADFIGDYFRLQQVIVNLLSNAIKFTQTGEIVLRVGRIKTPLNRGKSPAANSVTLEFSVSDTGIGIPQAKLEQIFSPFMQADGNTARNFGGTGLGLSISKRLVEMMGGKMSVESNEGKGSNFRFTVNLLADENARHEGEREITDIIKDWNVLVVDDNSVNLQLMNRILRSWNIKPDLAGSAAEALVLINKNVLLGRSYQMVLTDSKMPEIDGFEFVRFLKADSRHRQPVIMMLGSSDLSDDIGRAKELEVDAYAIKPIIAGELKNTILSALKASRTKETTAAKVPAAEKSLKILVVEDNLINRNLALKILQRLGHRTTLAESGGEALAHFEKESFDMVLMDMQMPGMDGIEATHKIRAIERISGAPATPIMAMTANAMKEDKDKCFAAGMNDYVSKPISIAALNTAILRLSREFSDSVA